MSTGAARVLIAEDDPTSAYVLQLNLEARGFHVTLAHNGREAWEMLEAEHFEVLLSDVHMPEMGGVDLVAALRSDVRYAKTPVMFVTAKGFEIDVPRIKHELGISHFFTKPFSPRDVVRAVRDCLEHKQECSNEETRSV